MCRFLESSSVAMVRVNRCLQGGRCSDSRSCLVVLGEQQWSSRSGQREVELDGASGWKGPGGGRKHAVGSRIGRSGGQRGFGGQRRPAVGRHGWRLGTAAGGRRAPTVIGRCPRVMMGEGGERVLVFTDITRSTAVVKLGVRLIQLIKEILQWLIQKHLI